MSPLTRIFIPLLFLSTRLLAESPVELGLQGALNAFRTVPDSISKEAQHAATDILRPYLKPTRNGFYILNKGNTGRWIEIRDLSVTRTSHGPLSQADRRNGISERILVSFSASMHRLQQPGNAWSEWRNGMSGFLPSVVRVDKTNGRWSGSSTMLGILQPCNDQPITIPNRIAVSSPPVAKPRSRPAPSTTPRRQQPFTPSNPLTTPSSSTSPPPTPSAKTVADSLVSGLVKGGLPLLILIAIAAALIPTRKKRRRRHKPTPPALPKSPPPLPTTEATRDSYERREFLMTPAEQNFHAVLDSVASSACMISSKVRLADLFDALWAPGRQAAFNKIKSKHIDFVLTEPGTSRILCGIELDDRSHQRPDRIERDRFVNQLFESQSLPLFRVPWSRNYDPEDLRRSISNLIGRPLE